MSEKPSSNSHWKKLPKNPFALQNFHSSAHTYRKCNSAFGREDSPNLLKPNSNAKYEKREREFQQVFKKQLQEWQQARDLQRLNSKPEEEEVQGTKEVSQEPLEQQKFDPIKILLRAPTKAVKVNTADNLFVQAGKRASGGDRKGAVSLLQRAMEEQPHLLTPGLRNDLIIQICKRTLQKSKAEQQAADQAAQQVEMRASDSAPASSSKPTEESARQAPMTQAEKIRAELEKEKKASAVEILLKLESNIVSGTEN